MEICILAKSTMNKNTVYLILLILMVNLFGCKTATHTDYVTPDFTNAEILDNEIERIRQNREEDSVNSLWLTYLLYNETKNENVKKLYKECAELIEKQFYEYVEKEDWSEASRLAQSLLLLNEASVELVYLLDDTFFENYELAITSYESRPLLNNTQPELASTPSQIATYITGVVTIWVDLGVKVERGLGYPNRKIGSGFFIDERGYIITNHHVIEELVDPEYEGYSRLYIKLSHDSETRIPAKVIGWDKTLDLALIKTEITPPYVYTLGSSQNLNIGNPIYAVGSPLGLENTITSGIISAFDRQLLATAAVMQIDAAVNSGNSGGPLINENGEVQGIVFAGLPTYQGLNFAIPVEYLRAIMLRLYSEGLVEHSWVGAYGRTKKEYPSDEEGLGVEVLYVMPGSPAYNAGLKKGSLISEINGIRVSSLEELQFALIMLRPDSISTIVYQNATETEVTTSYVYLDIRPEQPGLEIYEREPEYKMVYPLFGMELIPSSVGNKNQFTVQSIIKGSIADESGFSVHDPVEIRNTELLEEEGALFIETFTKKRKSGYFEVNVAIGAALDSPFIF